MEFYYNLLVNAGVDAIVASWAVSIASLLVVYFIFQAFIHIFTK